MNYAQIYFKKKKSFFVRILDFKNLLAILLAASICIIICFFFLARHTPIIDKSVSNGVNNIGTDNVVSENVAVPTGLTIHTFNDFDIDQNIFSIAATLSFIWPKKEDKSLLDEIRFENATFLSKSKPLVRSYNQDYDLVCYDIILSYKGDFNYHYYPFDRHRISLIVANDSMAPVQPISFAGNGDNFKISPGAFTRDWQMITKHVVIDRQPMQGVHPGLFKQDQCYDRIIFSIDYQRQSGKLVYFIFLPLFLIFFIGLLSLTFDVVEQFSVILSLSLGSTSALIFYVQQLNKVSPSAGIFTIADRIYILLLAIIICSFTLQIISLHILQKKRIQTNIPELIQETASTINIIHALVFIGFIVVMLLTVVYTLFIY